MTDHVHDGTIFGPGQPCFGCGPDHPFGFHLTFKDDGDELVARFVPGEHYQGPPGIMHGGLVLTLADETAAWACIAKLGKFGFTAQIQGKLLKPIRIGIEVEARSRIVRETARIVNVEVRVLQSNVEMFKGDLAFVILDETGAERLIGGPLPDAWKRFSRKKT